MNDNEDFMRIIGRLRGLYRAELARAQSVQRPPRRAHGRSAYRVSSALLGLTALIIVGALVVKVVAVQQSPRPGIGGGVIATPASETPSSAVAATTPTANPTNASIPPSIVFRTATPSVASSTAPRRTPDAVDDCRDLVIADGGGEHDTTLALELGWIDIIGYGKSGGEQKFRARVEFLDPACLAHPVIGPIIDHVMADLRDDPGCDSFRALLAGGTVGYRGQPLDPSAVDEYMTRWCGSE